MPIDPGGHLYPVVGENKDWWRDAVGTKGEGVHGVPGLGEKVPGMDVQPLLPLIQASIRAFRMGLGKIVSRDKVEAESGF